MVECGNDGQWYRLLVEITTCLQVSDEETKGLNADLLTGDY